MRTGLTALAVLVILALTAALVGPHFVDWSKQRGAVETQLSRVLGERVRIGGPIGLSLLPSPYLRLGQVEVADGKSGLFFSCEGMLLELGLTSLVRGQFRFTQASFEHPTIDVRQGPHGQLLLPSLALATPSESVALDKVIVRDGRLNLMNGATKTQINGIDLDAEADSLSGPFKGSGKAVGSGGATIAFHFATGAIEGAELRLKAVVEPEQGGVRGEFDGALALTRAAPVADVAAVGYSGAATFTGQVGVAGAQTPWRASGVLKADLRLAELSNLDFRLGPEDRALAAEGSAQIEFGAAPHAIVNLVAKQLNLDALLRADGEDSMPPARAYDDLSRVLSAVRLESGPPIALTIGLQTQAVILGGDTISDVSLSAAANPGEPVTGSLEASLPGRSHFMASGTIDLGPALGFKGRVEAQTEEAQRLREWIASGAPALAARLSSLNDFLPYQSVSASGEMDFSAAGFVARDLNFMAERSAFTGTVALTRAVGTERGRMFVDLQTDSLDLDMLPDFGASSDLFGDVDLAVTLNARAVRIARLGEAAVDGGALALKLTKQGDDVRLERLSLGTLAGASVEASGAIDDSGRWLNATIDAGKLRDFAMLVRRVAPGPISEKLADRAEQLSPAKLDLKARWSRATSGLTGWPDSLNIEGVAGATHVDARIARAAADPNAANATLLLDAPDAAPLLQQIGVPAHSVANLGRGRVSASFHGRWGGELEGEFAATLGGVDLTWRGRLGMQSRPMDGAPTLSGEGGLKSANAGPLLAALGVTSPTLSLTAPTDVSAQVSWRANELDVAQVSGAIGPSHIAGNLTFRAAPPEPAPLTPVDPDLKLAEAAVGGAAAVSAPQPQLEGALSLDRLPFTALAGLALGPPQPGPTKSLWSSAKFGPGLAGAPSADVAVKIAALDLAGNLVGRNASARLKLGRGLVGLDDVSMSLAGSAVSGRLTIRRNGADASLAGRLSIEPVSVDRPIFAGRLSGALEFSATGQSAGALVAGLAGTGQIQLSGARIPRLDQGALGRIVDKAKSSDYAIDEVNVSHALDLEFNRQPLRLPDGSAPASLTAGVLRLGPVETRNATDAAKVEATFDIGSSALALRAAFTELQTPKYWSGPPPAVTIVLNEAPGAPTRQIDSGLLVAGMAAQAIARETERIAALESDIRERAFFNRRLKADQFLRRRELELEAYAVEQQRRKWDADRRRVEDETLKAADEKRKAAASDPSFAPLPPPLPDPTQHDPLQSDTRTFAEPTPPLPAPRPPRPVVPSAGGIY